MVDNELLADPADGAWLGHYRSDAGNWECSSDAPSAFTQWAPGEPAVAEFECAHMAPSNLRKRGKWVSALCSEKRRCVCALGANASTAYNATRLEVNAAVVDAEIAAQGRLVIAMVLCGLGVWMLLSCCAFIHLYRVCARRLAEARLNAPISLAAAGPDAEATDVAMRGDTDDSSLVAMAETKLKAAREAATSVRRSINIASGVAVALSVVVLFPLILLLIFYDLPFAPAGVAYVAVLAVAVPSQYDPTLQRSVRAMLAGAATIAFPLFSGIFSALAVQFALTPMLFDTCSTRKPSCASGAWVLTGACASFSCSLVLASAVMLPALYATRDTPLPPVNELLQKQKRAIAVDGAAHPCQHRSNPAYLLEGANFFAMPVQVAMERFFRMIQGLHVVQGPVICLISISLHSLDLAPTNLTWGGFFPLGLAFATLFPVACSPPVRRAIVTWLGRLGTEGEARQAAAVAGLLGGLSPARVLAFGKATFRGVLLNQIMPADLDPTEPIIHLDPFANYENKTMPALSRRRNWHWFGRVLATAAAPDGAVGSTSPRSNDRIQYFRRSVPLALGACDAFVCHSWHDDAKAAHAALVQYCARFEAVHGRTPMVWFDLLCIDQNNTAAALACLPVYLAGSQRLLVLAGPTFVQRLWCIFEVFTFIRMSGAIERIEIAPLGDGPQFEQFACEQATCTLAQDKARLLTAIESGFGSYAPFNVLVRRLLNSATSVDVASA